jgi:hypothetical protein
MKRNKANKPDPQAVEFMGGHRPTAIEIDKDLVQTLHDSMKLAIEYTTMYLEDHDFDHGRKTLKNIFWAEKVEDDIRKMKKILEQLPAL